MTNLKKCKDCGKEISKSASSCPHCGAKPPGFGSFVALVIVCLAIGIFLITSCSKTETVSKVKVEMSNNFKRFKADSQNFYVVIDDKTQTLALENMTGKALQNVEFGLSTEGSGVVLYGIKLGTLPEKVTQFTFSDLKKDTGTLQTGSQFTGESFNGTLKDIKYFVIYSPSTKGFSVPIKN